MKKFILIFFLISSSGCTNGKQVYWCGDHACKNNKEKKAYFNNNMSVEIKEINKKKKKEYSEIKKITEQAFAKTKVKNNKDINLDERSSLDEKEKIKREKIYAKQLIKNEKVRIKEEKKEAKRLRKEEKKIAKILKLKEKKINKKSKNSNEKVVVADVGVATVDVSEFKKLMDQIYKRNTSKPYPNINKAHE